MTADLVIRGGAVVDGSGAPAVRADVAVTGGRITAIGTGLDGARTLDAGGHVVAPGFIDIHTHYDAQVFWDPALTPSCHHGVTTVVAGNCGFSIAPVRPEHRSLVVRTLENVEDMDRACLEAGVPWDFETFPEYLASIERRGVALNFLCYAGHTALRLFVMGEDAYERAGTAEEVGRMEAVLREALLAGAAGFATSMAPTHVGAGGKPIPSRFAERGEIEALFAVVGDVGRGVVALTIGQALPAADLYDIQPRIGVPITYTALVTTPTGTHRELVELNRAGWERGAQVWPQVTPRPIVFDMSLAEPFVLNMNAQFAALMAGGFDERRAAYADRDWRRRVEGDWEGRHGPRVPRWEAWHVSRSTAHPELVDRPLVDVAAQRSTSPLDVVLDLALDEPDCAARMRVVLANGESDEIAGLLADEHCTLGLSDAGAHVGQLCDAPQATDFLGNWVRDRQVVPLETAVRKLTGVQADLFGLVDRGYLRPNAWADIVVFDPETVAPGPTHRVADFPAGAERLTADQPVGIRHVLVNGVPIRVDGEHRPDARPGRRAELATRR